MSLESCSVRLCRKPAVNNSPITCQALCTFHLKTDMSKVETLETQVAQRITYFRKYTTPLRLMQQRLTSDLQCLDDNFNALRDSLDKCQKELVDIITQQHDQLLDSLKTLSDLDDFEKDLKSAKQQNDMRQVFLLNESVDKSLETLQLDSNLVCIDEETQLVKMVAYPDVNAKVRDLQTCVGLEFYHLQTKLVSLDAKNPKNRTKITATKIKSEGNALCAAMCSNTRGFAIDESGSITRAQTGQDVDNKHNVPQPCVFVAVKSVNPVDSISTDSDSSHCDEQHVYKIMLVCADPQVTATLTCSWDESLPIVDLHCDNSRQNLFVAQPNAITVTDLAGISESKICIQHLHDEAKKIYCICGDCDKLYVLLKLNNKNQVIFGLAIETAEVQMQIPVPSTCDLSLGLENCIEVRDRMLIISDAGDVFTICSITGCLVSSEEVAESTSLITDLTNKLSDVDEDSEDYFFSMAKFLSKVSNRRVSVIGTVKVWMNLSLTLLMQRNSNYYVYLLMMDDEWSLIRGDF